MRLVSRCAFPEGPSLTMDSLHAGGLGTGGLERGKAHHSQDQDLDRTLRTVHVLLQPFLLPREARGMYFKYSWLRVVRAHTHTHTHTHTHISHAPVLRMSLTNGFNVAAMVTSLHTGKGFFRGPGSWRG